MNDIDNALTRADEWIDLAGELLVEGASVEDLEKGSAALDKAILSLREARYAIENK